MQGHGVASGSADDSPYEDGAIILQTPHFKARGLDISAYYPGTINVSVAPYTAKLLRPDTTLRQVDWHASIDPEDFSFLALQIRHAAHVYEALFYCPSPETKPAHYQNPDILEVLASRVPGLEYGDKIELGYPDGCILIQ